LALAFLTEGVGLLVRDLGIVHLTSRIAGIYVEPMNAAFAAVGFLDGGPS
jgi:hypothetical protein